MKATYPLRTGPWWLGSRLRLTKLSKKAKDQRPTIAVSRTSSFSQQLLPSTPRYTCTLSLARAGMCFQWIEGNKLLPDSSGSGLSLWEHRLKSNTPNPSFPQYNGQPHTHEIFGWLFSNVYGPVWVPPQTIHSTSYVFSFLAVHTLFILCFSITQISVCVAIKEKT